MSGLPISRILGGNDQGKRSKLDYYPTPPEVTAALMDFLQLPKETNIWEPACGDGRMADTLRRLGYSVLATDIQTGQDFLTMPFPGADWIITNPPFSLAEEFIERAWQHKRPFAFLLKAHYWNAKSRLPLFERIQPQWVLPLTWRPNFRANPTEKRESPVLDFAWCVWTPGRTVWTFYKPLRKVDVKKYDADRTTGQIGGADRAADGQNDASYGEAEFS